MCAGRSRVSLKQTRGEYNIRAGRAAERFPAGPQNADCPRGQTHPVPAPLRKDGPAHPAAAPRSRLSARARLAAVAGVLLGMGLPASAQQPAAPPPVAPQQQITLLPAQGPDTPAAMVVFDGSGSMAAPLAATRLPKVGVAREALARTLQRLPPQMRVGLAAFGHRRGDCGDIEVMRPAETLDAARFAQAADKITPRGRGPLTQALRVAARALPAGNTQRTLILVYDDADNCMLDLCAAAADLARAKVVVHTVGLALKPEDRPKMMCVTQLTKGRSYVATTAEEVGAAIDDAFKLAAAELLQKPVAPARPLEGQGAGAEVPDTAPPGLYLRARLSDKTQPLGEAMHWIVTPEGEGRIPVFEGRAVNPHVPVRAGRYRVELRDGPVVAQASVTVSADKPTLAVVSLDAGVLRIRIPAQKSGLNLPRLLVSVSKLVGDAPPALAAPAGEVVGAFQGSEGNLLLPAGRYVVRVEAGLLRTQRVVALDGGADQTNDIPLEAGVLQLAAATAFPGLSPVFTLLEDDPDAPKGRREVARSADRNAEFVVAPGTYTVVMRLGDVETRERVLVTGGDVARRALAVAGAQVSLASRLGPQALDDNVTYRIDRVDSGGGEFIMLSRPQPVVLLAAGKYRIEARYGSANARVLREVEVKAGAPLQQVTFEQQAGDVRLRAVNPPGEVFWEVRDQSGAAVWSSGQPEPELTLQAGRYTVRAQARDKRVEAVLDLRAGDKRTTNMSFE
jgi:Ca-activated chloride channel family protein